MRNCVDNSDCGETARGFGDNQIDASVSTSLEARGVHTVSRTDIPLIAVFSAMKTQIAAVMADVLG